MVILLDYSRTWQYFVASVGTEIPSIRGIRPFGPKIKSPQRILFAMEKPNFCFPVRQLLFTASSIITCNLAVYLHLIKATTIGAHRGTGATEISAALDFAGLSPEENDHEKRTSAFHHLASVTQRLRP
jgi:hypothetical protein